MTDIVEFIDSNEIDFTVYSKGKNIAKPEVMGEELWKKLFERDPRFGGVSCAFYGVPGSGKTSLMLQICKRIAATKPNEIIFWREPWGVPVQITNIGIPVRFFSASKLGIRIHELTEKGAVNNKDIKVYKFQHIGQLLDKIEPGINVIYFNDRKGWLRLFDRMKLNLTWTSVFLDEAEDIFSSRVGGKDWYLNEQFCSDIKDFRKARNSIFLNTQTDWDVDPRIKSKLMLEVFLYGSKKNKDSPLYRGVLQDIELGEGWITYAHSLFGKIRFDPVEPQQQQYIALPKGHVR